MSKFFAKLVAILTGILFITCLVYEEWIPAFMFAFMMVLAINAVTEHK